ncbi:MAG: flagellin [Desulfobacter sp.]
MALTINTNVAALSAHQSMIANDNKLSESLGRLSTGLRINKAADDASGMTIADSLKAQYLGIGQAVQNANDGISMVQTADGALEESINIINTIKTKAIQAATDSQTTNTRKAIQADIDALMEELDVIAQTTSYNGQNLLSGVFSNKKIHIGAYSGQTASVSIGSAESTKIGHVSTAQLSLASDAGGEVQLTITSSITGEELTLNTIDLQANNSPENGMGALADEINRYTSTTGISAAAVVETTSSTAIQAGSTSANFSINGITIGAIEVEGNDSSGSLAAAINDKTTEHGVSASINSDGTMTLTSTDGRAIDVDGSISDIFGSTSAQMSTFGYLDLTQAGSAEFQINGIGAGATGADITISGDMTTTEDSVVAAGSTINAGSLLASGTAVGGDAAVESSIAETSQDYELVSGSTLYSFSQLAVGTELGGAVTIGGDTSTGGGSATAITQNMLVSAGSTLTADSVLGKGTVVTTEFTIGTTTYSVGDTLTSAVTLTSDLTVDADMTLAYSSTAGDNSAIFAGTTLAAGSTMGVELEIGATYDSDTTIQTVAANAASTGDLYLTGSTTFGSSAANAVIKAGSLLTNSTVLNLASTGGVWTGPTLVTNTGTLEYGDTFAASSAITLSGDQVLSSDLERGTDLTTTANHTIAAGSYLEEGSISSLAIGDGSSAFAATLTTATLSEDMTLKAGSELSTGSKMLAGSILGGNTYVMGGSIDATQDNLTTYDTTQLKAGSTLESGSVMAEGSTVGGSLTVSGNTTLQDDMSVTSGTTLKQDTLLKAGTVITQDMTLNVSAGGTATSEVSVTAGEVLTNDLYLDADTTLSADMTLVNESVIQGDSVLAINTTNSGSVGLSDTEFLRLSDLSVLTQEDANIAIDIADAALADLDGIRSSLGSVQNQLTSTIANLSTTKTNIQASESTIRDVDFAEEASTYSKLNLLAQTSSYALAQANASSQNVISLLQ